MIEDIGAFISDEVPYKKELRDFLMDGTRRRNANGTSEVIWKQDVVVEETSGTSGLPFNFPKTTAERLRSAIGIWKYRREIDPSVSTGKFYPFTHAPVSSDRILNPHDCSPSNVKAVYEHLEKAGVTWIHSSPALMLRHVAALGKNASLHPCLKFIELSGAFVTDEAKRCIEKGMSVRVINQYGCREVWAIGVSLDNKRFAAIEDNVFIEIVDENDRPIGESEVLGSLIVTARHQKLFPFVRYRTGDSAMWSSGGAGRSISLHQKFISGETDNIANSGLSGSEYFRMMLTRAYRITGFLSLRYLQVRQIGSHTFVLVTEGGPPGDRLRHALETVCNAKVSDQRINVLLQVASVDEVARMKSTQIPLFIVARGAHKDSGYHS
jgi:phenylacetate-CoA ligase